MSASFVSFSWPLKRYIKKIVDLELCFATATHILFYFLLVKITHVFNFRLIICKYRYLNTHFFFNNSDSIS